MKLKRGDVVRVRLDLVEGSEQAGERPAVVISPEIINKHSPVVIVAAITSRKIEKIYPFEVLIEPPESGLKKKSKVLLLHIRSIDKRRIIGKYGSLSYSLVKEIDEALKIAIGLKEI